LSAEVCERTRRDGGSVFPAHANTGDPNGQGDRIGSLERGKEADFTILESDPYKVRPDAIADIKVSETWVAGERKFAA